MNKFLAAILLCFLSAGCSSTGAWESTAAKWLIPVNATAAYFGSVALHEAGHAIPADALGADYVKIDYLPTRDQEGQMHLALTTYSGEFTDREHTIINTMGPTAQFVGYVGSRELLKTCTLPRIIQPTLGFFAVFNQIGYYYHVISGLARRDSTDLGKERAWISGVMLGGGLLYELYDFFLDDDPLKKYGVLFGEAWYDGKKPDKRRFRFIAEPRRGGGFLGIGGDF